MDYAFRKNAKSLSDQFYRVESFRRARAVAFSYFGKPQNHKILVVSRPKAFGKGVKWRGHGLNA